MITDLINSLQTDLNQLILTNKSDISYSKTVFPIAMKLFQELEKGKSYPKKLVLDERIDIYCEAIALKVIHNYSKGIKENTLPLHCYVILLIKHPYLISLLQCQRTRKEWIEFRKKLLEECDTMFGDDYPFSQVNEFKEFMSTSINDQTDKISSLQMFHYMIGFRFESEGIGITYEQLPKDNNTSFLIINLSYNLKKKDSIVIYKSIDKIKEKLLNINTIDNFNPYLKPEKINDTKVPFIKVDNNLNIISTLTNKVYILLCYNDSDDYKKCHYTISYYDQDGFVNKEFAESFINGSIPKILTDKDITLYMESNFFKKINDEPEDIKELKESYIMFLNIIKDSFNKSTQKTIVDTIMNNENLNLVFDKTEIPFLRVYLSRLKTLEVFNLANVVSYSLSYIYPDLFGSMKDFNN